MSKKIELPEYLRAKILSEDIMVFILKVMTFSGDDFRMAFKSLAIDSRMAISDAISTLSYYLPEKSEE